MGEVTILILSFYKTENDKNPKYLIPLILTVQIGWIPKNKTSGLVLTAFSFKYKNNFKNIIANN